MRYKFSELFDIDKLQTLMEDFTEVTEGTATAILDLDGTVLVATGWKDICTKFHRVHPQTGMRCTESDTALAGRLSKGESYNIYKCLNGLVDVAVPIIVQNEHMGNLFIGQFLFEPPDVEFFRNQAAEYGFDEAAYLDALSEVPVVPENQVRKIMNFLAGLASLIGEMGLTQKRQLEVNEKLQRLDKLKDEFLANTSHELRTPLNGIIGIAESMLDGAVGPMTTAQHHNLSLIVSGGRRLANLVNDILDFSKLRHHKLRLRTKALDMRSVTDVVLMLSRAIVGNKEIQLVNQIEAGLPAVRADEDRVQQILHNLVGNAVKFTHAGTVSVSARVQDGCMAVTVSDTGIGIPKDKLGRIFESFEQADGSTAREYGGTGLGLAVTKQLTELHGGQIRAESDPGRGSRFTFTLPVSEGNAEPVHTADILTRDTRVTGISVEPLEIGHSEAPDLADIPPEHLCAGDMCRILAVDDEPINLQILRNQLASEHYSVTLAADGKEAIAALESGQKFDLVLLDVMMPGMSGYEVCRELRKTYPETELPVVMLTAKNQIDDLVAGFDSGASDYLIKPFSKKELIARIDTHVSLRYLHISRMKAETEARLLAREMDIAKHIQTGLVPERPELAGYDIATAMEPADKVGGDYYDVISVAGHDWIIIGDVSGHGVPAGLVMMMAQTAIHTALIGNPEVPPSCLLSLINKIIYDNIERMDESKHMTIVVLAAGTDGKFSFSGLHEDILIRRAGTGKVEKIESDGMWIGLEPDISEFLSDNTFHLGHGDCMVLFTDGITEALCEDGELFGDDRLIEIIEASGQASASQLRDNILTALEPCATSDDVTLMVMRRTGRNPLRN